MRQKLLHLLLVLLKLASHLTMKTSQPVRSLLSRWPSLFQTRVSSRSLAVAAACAPRLRQDRFSASLNPPPPARARFSLGAVRHESAVAATPGGPSRPTKDSRKDELYYRLTFTCRPCNGRSTHQVSHHGYHKGTVLITCPQCKNRHIISDHLKVSSSSSSSSTTLLSLKGVA